MLKHLALSLFFLLVGHSIHPTAATPTSSSNGHHSRLVRRQGLKCGSGSGKSIGWHLDTFRFESSIVFSTPAHRSSANGRVAFNMTNAALPFRVSCEASSIQMADFFYGDQWFTCQNESGDNTDPASAAYQSEAQFQYNKANGLLNVVQKWTCYEDAGYTQFWRAWGAGNISLACTSSKWQNEQWTDGQVYSTEQLSCSAQNVKADVTQVEAVS